nr:hypothetical protein [Saprospiraceae bacterium]
MIQIKSRNILCLQAIVLICMIIFTTSSCRVDYKDPIPDVSEIEVELTFIHFDEQVRKEFEKEETDWEALMEKHPSFSSLYFEHILDIWSPGEPLDSLEVRMDYFLSSPYYIMISDTVAEAFPNMDFFEDDMEQAFAFFKYYFPYKSLPVIYYFVAEFTYGNVIFEHESGADGLGVGLDMFLHGYFDYSVMSPFNTVFSGYNTRTFNRDHMAKKAFDAIWNDLLGPSPHGQLIDVMLYYGKIHHLNKLVFPHTPDTVIFEYTHEQMEWVTANEYNIYNHLVENDLLYSIDMNKFSRLVNPSPHSPGMPPEAPGRVVNWLAYKMVRAWISNNPNKTLEDLIDLTDGHEFLLQSRYRPGRY